MTELSDDRTIADFRTRTFSNYRKASVAKELVSSIADGRVEEANFFSAELLASGHLDDWWDAVICSFGKYIHCANPKAATYLAMRIQTAAVIIKGEAHLSDNLLWTRNDSRMRALLCEVTTILALSAKGATCTQTIVHAKDLHPDVMRAHFEAPNCEFGKGIVLPDDPREIFIGVNEFAYAIHADSPNSDTAIYWVEWILTFENVCKKRKEKVICQRRSVDGVPEKFQMDCVWVIWAAMAREATERHDHVLTMLLKSTFELFCFQYCPSTIKAKGGRFLIYYGIKLLTQNTRVDIDSIGDAKLAVAAMLAGIDDVYKQIATSQNLTVVSVENGDDDNSNA